MTLFSELGLAEPILSALSAKGYTTPTPIQHQAIPQVLTGRDLLGIAATGTGKTAAFALPLLDRLARNPQRPTKGGCRALILSPTRELSQQIAESFRAYGAHLKLRVTTLIGGMPMRPQAVALHQGVDIIVATPGRLLDHVEQGNVRLDGVEVLVLDEADHMLDLGFIPAIRRIVRALPKARQNLFFSATMPGEISALANDMLRDPVTVSVAPQSTTAERVTQSVIHVDQARKAGLLAQLVRAQNMARTLVFARTKHGSDKIVRSLEAAGIDALAIHGNKSQGQRVRALNLFKSGEVPVLVATDIAARGIDVDGVALVINYDLPHVPETYVHRIGRTARNGAEGEAIAFCNAEEKPLLRVIEKVIRTRVPVRIVEGLAQIAPAPREARAPQERDPRANRDRERDHRGPRAPRREDRAETRGPKPHRKGPSPQREDGARAEGSRDGQRRFGPRPESHKGPRPQGEGHRAEGHRTEGHRSEGSRGDAKRTQHHRSDTPRADKPRADQPRSGKPQGKSANGKNFGGNKSRPFQKRAGQGPSQRQVNERRARHA